MRVEIAKPTIDHTQARKPVTDAIKGRCLQVERHRFWMVVATAQDQRGKVAVTEEKTPGRALKGFAQACLDLIGAGQEGSPGFSDDTCP